MAQGMITRRGGGGSTTAPLTITVTTSDGASAAGSVVVITDTDAGTVFARHEYTGEPYKAAIPIGMRYRVEVEYYYGYQTPEAVTGTALAGTKRSIEFVFLRGTRYGYKREKANSEPSARYTYLYDAVGMTPAYMDYDAGEFNFGSWLPFIEAVSRPVMLKTDGTVDYELDHDDQTKKLDGTASDVSNTSYDGNFMVEFGSAFKWVKRYEDDAFEYVIFCDVQFDEDYHAYAHTNESGDVVDAFYWGGCKGTYSKSRTRSIAAGSPMVDLPRSTEISRAQVNGEGYGISYKSGLDYICDLLHLIGCSDATQVVFGRGREEATAALACGTTKSYGPFYGLSRETAHVKVFWIEDFWGNVRESMAGMIADGSNGIKVKMVPPYNLTGEGYTETGIVPSGTSGGFISAESVSSLGFIPKTADGSSTTYIGDELRFNSTVVGYALIGGAYSHSAYTTGAHTMTLAHIATRTGATTGSRLTYVPPTA